MLRVVKFAVLLPVWLAWTVVCLLAMMLDAALLAVPPKSLPDSVDRFFGRCVSIQGAIGQVMLGGRW